MDLRASQISLVHDLFVRTADENYVTARWCAVNQLNIDFYWLAVHALEKYLKAVLLLNGKSSKRYGHNIVKLYDKVKGVAGALLPDWLEKPPKLVTSYWTRMTAEKFVERLLSQGNADNRYLIYGYSMMTQDLHMLDRMVFAVRRIIISLDEPAFRSSKSGAPKPTHREQLTRNPDYFEHFDMPLDRLIRAKKDSPARNAALNLNVPFAPGDFNHTPIRSGHSSRNPVILRRILEPLESDNRRRASDGLAVAGWFLANVQVPRGKAGDPGVAEQIEDAMKAAKAKHGLP